MAGLSRRMRTWVGTSQVWVTFSSATVARNRAGSKPWRQHLGGALHHEGQRHDPGAVGEGGGHEADVLRLEPLEVGQPAHAPRTSGSRGSAWRPWAGRWCPTCRPARRRRCRPCRDRGAARRRGGRAARRGASCRRPRPRRGRGRPARSCSTPSSSRRPRATSVNSSPTMKTRAPQSVTWYWTSSRVSRALRGEIVAPAFHTANSVSSSSGLFDIITATRSPGWTFRSSTRPTARAEARSSTSR